MLGDTGVGKTSIALRFTNDTFQPRTNPTIGASFLMKSMTVDDKKIKLQIWDTAGQERFRSLAPMYYRGASAAVLVYDITSAFSYNKVKEWVNELKVNVTDDITMVVVGNKLDRAQKHRQLQTEVGQEYATSVGASFTETSAKTGEGIEAVFLEIAKKLIKNSEEKHTVAESDKVTSSSGGGLNVNSPNGKTNEISDSCCQD
uniref:Uncharacterized protein n=1 Tax=Arcella intermedia TaxID=1963864 RepID=A0A6B2LI94_9EUKA